MTAEKTASNNFPSENLIQKAIDAARTTAQNAYAPYSHFHVGAAAVMTDEQLICGCNVENASYPVGCCAEKAALAAAVARGYQPQDMAGIVLYTPTAAVTSPCGSCRQVMAELLGPDGFVIMECDNPALQKRMTVRDLLPAAFSLEEKSF
ncbi:MAG: cytidine deaminase [Erysipelotrichaceae bacterium]|mgnify:CR=1 FL=1|nr:cytidine deaminase [Erysipelotrichaceae bacterium]